MQEKQEIQILSLGWEDALEKEMATHSSILAWKILWTEEPGVANSPWGHKESDMTETNTSTSTWGKRTFPNIILLTIAYSK